MVSVVMLSRAAQAMVGVAFGDFAFGVAWNPTYHRFFERFMRANARVAGFSVTRVTEIIWRAMMALPLGALSLLSIAGAAIGR